MTAKGQHLSKETRDKIRQANLGKKLSPETREKMSISRTGEKHPFYGKHHSEKSIEKMRISRKGKCIGENNPNFGEKAWNWKGDKVGYYALHDWVTKYLPKPGLCSICSEKKKLELCNISPTYNPETYTRDLGNWLWSCQLCHVKSDGRLARFNSFPHEKRVEMAKKAWVTKKLKNEQ